MRRILVDLVLILAAFTVQNCVFPLIPVLVSTPNLLLILTFSFAFMDGRRVGMACGILAGVLLDLFYSGPFGFYTLFYVYVGYLNGVCTKYFYEDYVTIPLILSIVNELAYNLYVYVFRFLIRGRVDFLYYFRELMVPETIFTVVTTLFLYRLLLRINRKLKDYESGRDTTLV